MPWTFGRGCTTRTVQPSRHNLEIASGSSPPTNPDPDPKSILPKLFAALNAAVVLLVLAWVITRPNELTVGAATLSPSELSFEDQIVGTTSEPQAVTIANDGDDELSLQASPDARAFALAGRSCGALAARGTCTIEVAFSPGDTVRLDATLLVVVDPGRDIEVPVSGVGITAEVDVSPTSLKFGDIHVGESSEAQSVTVSNPGETDLDVTVVASDFGEFDVMDGCSLNAIGSGEACTIDAVFSPTASGPQSAGIVIEHNARGDALTVTLKGNGAGAAIDVSRAGLTFKSQVVDTMSEPMTFTITNSGTAALETTVALGGENSAEFAVTGDACSGMSLPPGTSCRIGVVFQPSSEQIFNASVTIAHNAGDTPVTVALSGSGFRVE